MFCCTLHIARSIHFIYWSNYTLHTAHCMLYTLHKLTQVQTTHYTVLWIESLVYARSGRVEWQPREGLNSTVLCFTTPHWVCYCTLLYFTAIYGTILLNLEDPHCFNKIVFYSRVQCKAFDTLLVLQIVLFLFLLLVVPTFKFNLLFDDSMPVGIMEKKLFMENL